MNELTNYQNYSEFKAELDAELRKSVEGFVRIGYLLRQARDTDILKDSGYENVNDFASAEYGLEKSAVSRFIAINERFTLPEDHTQLREQYRGAGHAKLAIMLTLPDELDEEISADFSKSEILEIKQEYDEEKKISDLEVWAETRVPAQEELDTILEKALHEIGHNSQDMFRDLFKDITESGESHISCMQMDLAPNGEAIHTMRIPGIGKIMMSVKGVSQPIAIINVRSGEREEYGWDALLAAVRKVFCIPDVMPEGGIDWKACYKAAYGEEPAEPEEKKAEVAPVQQKQKASKVIKSVPKKEKKDESERRAADEAGGHRKDSQGRPEAGGSIGQSDSCDGGGTPEAAGGNRTDGRDSGGARPQGPGEHPTEEPEDGQTAAGEEYTEKPVPEAEEAAGQSTEVIPAPEQTEGAPDFAGAMNPPVTEAGNSSREMLWETIRSLTGTIMDELEKPEEARDTEYITKIAEALLMSAQELGHSGEQD